MPIENKWVVPVIAILTVFCLINFFIKQDKFHVKFTPLYLISIIFFAYCLGLINTSNTVHGWKEVESRASFIVFPLIFYSLKRFKVKLEIPKISFAWVLGCFIASILGIIEAFDCYNEVNESICFKTSNIAFNIHPTYLAMYMIIAIMLLLETVLNNPNRVIKALALILACYFMTYTYKLNSFGCFISVAISLALFGVYKLFSDFTIRKVMYFGFITTLIIVISIGLNLNVQLNKFVDTIHQFRENKSMFYNYSKKNVESIKTRLVVWDLSIDLIKKNPYGFGTGDIKDELVSEYGNLGLIKLQERRYNPHNQFLQSTLALGIPFLIVFIMLILLWMKRAWKSRNISLLFFLIFFFLNSLAESTFEKQDGILFFTYWLFLFDNEKNKVI
jgi:O-antigen ligase